MRNKNKNAFLNLKVKKSHFYGEKKFVLANEWELKMSRKNQTRRSERAHIWLKLLFKITKNTVVITIIIRLFKVFVMIIVLIRKKEVSCPWRTCQQIHSSFCDADNLFVLRFRVDARTHKPVNFRGWSWGGGGGGGVVAGFSLRRDGGRFERGSNQDAFEKEMHHESGHRMGVCVERGVEHLFDGVFFRLYKLSRPIKCRAVHVAHPRIIQAVVKLSCPSRLIFIKFITAQCPPPSPSPRNWSDSGMELFREIPICSSHDYAATSRH